MAERDTLCQVIRHNPVYKIKSIEWKNIWYLQTTTTIFSINSYNKYYIDTWM